MRPDHPALLPRASAVTRAVSLATPGFWCEWRHADGRRITCAARPTPSAAIRWARIQIRTIASAVEPDLVDSLVDRGYPGWRDAVSALAQGAHFTLPITAAPLSFVWHARPVLVMAVVGGTPLPHLPAGDPPWG
ncbi:hypothetical protein [Streptomyces sp. 2A115]|uniref:hypothetical protein n=1 Tax=Streptomyces sp. 2A115 TaxID=3457439 RepID=UPI003FD40DE8